VFFDEDGTVTAQGENLRGLVLETESFKEMREELLRLVPQLLRANHGLNDDEIKETIICITRHGSADGKQQKRPRLMWEDTLPARAVA